MVIRIVKYLFCKIDLIFDFINPVLPKASDNFAFRNDKERQSYYDRYGAFANEPSEKFTINRVFILLLKGVVVFIGWWFFILLIYYLNNGWV